MDKRLYWLAMILATAAVGGFFGGLTAVGFIGLDPISFRAPPTPVSQIESERPCYKVDLKGDVIGRC